jgi:hypothetical protein
VPRSAFVKQFVTQAACIRDLPPHHPEEPLSDNVGQDGDSQILWSEGLGCPNDLGEGNEEQGQQQHQDGEHKQGERRCNHAGDGDYNGHDRYGDETESPRPAKRRKPPPSHCNSTLRRVHKNVAASCDSDISSNGQNTAQYTCRTTPSICEGDHESDKFTEKELCAALIKLCDAISVVSCRTSPYHLEEPLPNRVNPDSNRDVQEASSCSNIIAEDEQQYQEISQMEKQRGLDSNHCHKSDRTNNAYLQQLQESDKEKETQRGHINDDKNYDNKKITTTTTITAP